MGKDISQQNPSRVLAKSEQSPSKVRVKSEQNRNYCFGRTARTTLGLSSDCLRTVLGLFGLCSDSSDCPRTVLGQLGLSSESTRTMWLSVKYWDTLRPLHPTICILSRNFEECLTPPSQRRLCSRTTTVDPMDPVFHPFR